MWGWNPNANMSINMTAVEQSIRAAVAESEGRTTRAIGELRTDVATWRTAFMPHERIEDRWRRDDARLAEHDQQIDQLLRGQAQHDKMLAQLATKDDIADAVKEACSGVVTEEKVRTIVANTRSTQFGRWREVVLWIIMVLTFLSAQGFIHLSALFKG